MGADVRVETMVLSVHSFASHFIDGYGSARSFGEFYSTVAPHGAEADDEHARGPFGIPPVDARPGKIAARRNL